jgi:oligogalacturonide lyase
MKFMAVFPRRFSRRSLLLSGIAAAGLSAQGKKGEVFPQDLKHYADPSTELDVYRITSPEYSSALPAYYNRAIGRRNAFVLFCCDRAGSAQGFRLDLYSGEAKQVTDAENFDGASLSLSPDSRSFYYFAGRALHSTNLSTLRDRELYTVPDTWERSPGMNVGPDGAQAVFAETRGDQSRLRVVALATGAARTAIELPFVISDPIARPLRAQILCRQEDQALWLVNSDGSQKRQLKLAPGRIGPANWSTDGKTVLYLSFPEDPKQLNSIRECAPDSNSETLVAKTSQFAHFGFNRDSSVFIGASRNAASPTILILLRVTRRELTLCEHKASHPEAVAPRFSTDSQHIFFGSDRDGKPAIYAMHIDKLVERTPDDS